MGGALSCGRETARRVLLVSSAYHGSARWVVGWADVVLVFFVSGMGCLFFFFRLSGGLPNAPSFYLPASSEGRAVCICYFFFGNFSSIYLRYYGRVPSPVRGGSGLLVVGWWRVTCFIL